MLLVLPPCGSRSTLWKRLWMALNSRMTVVLLVMVQQPEPKSCNTQHPYQTDPILNWSIPLQWKRLCRFSCRLQTHKSACFIGLASTLMLGLAACVWLCCICCLSASNFVPVLGSLLMTVGPFWLVILDLTHVTLFSSSVPSLDHVRYV